MRLLIVVVIFMMTSGCVTYPRYKKQFVCNERQKGMIPEIAIDCIDSVHRQTQKDLDEAIDRCHYIALATVCSPAHYFQRVSLPFFSVTAEIECNKAETFIESYICDEKFGY